MKEPLKITLYDTDGAAIEGTVGRPTIETSNAVGDIAIRNAFISEERQALMDASTEINKEFALAELSGDAARLAKATAARTALLAKTKEKDDARRAALLSQFKLVVTLPKDAKKPAWEKTPLETIQEAISFFLTGKLPSETSAHASV